MKVAFVCLHGSAKSVIAAEHYRRLATRTGSDVEVIAAGVDPDEHIPPHVVSGLAGDGFDVSNRAPRHVAEVDLASADLVVSFGCELELQAPSQTVIRWDDIPAVSDGYATARDAIVARINELVQR